MISCAVQFIGSRCSQKGDYPSKNSQNSEKHRNVSHEQRSGLLIKGHDGGVEIRSRVFKEHDLNNHNDLFRSNKKVLSLGQEKEQ